MRIATDVEDVPLFSCSQSSAFAHTGGKCVGFPVGV